MTDSNSPVNPVGLVPTANLGDDPVTTQPTTDQALVDQTQEGQVTTAQMNADQTSAENFNADPQLDTQHVDEPVSQPFPATGVGAEPAVQAEDSAAGGDALSQLDELLAKAKAKRAAAPQRNEAGGGAEVDAAQQAQLEAQQAAAQAEAERKAAEAAMAAEQARQQQVAAQQAKMSEIEQSEQFKARQQQNMEKAEEEQKQIAEHVGHEIVQLSDQKVDQ